MYESDDPWLDRFSDPRVVPCCADICSSMFVNHHVIGGASNQRTEIRPSNHFDTVVREDLVVFHRHNQQAAIGKPTQSRRPVRNVHDVLHATVAGHAAHAPPEHVREVERTVVPAWTLWKLKLNRNHGQAGLWEHFCQDGPPWLGADICPRTCPLGRDAQLRGLATRHQLVPIRDSGGCWRARVTVPQVKASAAPAQRHGLVPGLAPARSASGATRACNGRLSGTPSASAISRMSTGHVVVDGDAMWCDFGCQRLQERCTG